jgi:alkanesulfonate monooxygenase SsuD/methylene tetrahydromethanopterin reductase-like flavin-dependent oxidoreductase (luciferase family)
LNGRLLQDEIADLAIELIARYQPVATDLRVIRSSMAIAIGIGVTAPILRYHPAIVAQVFATLGFMFPNRVFLGIGRAEALNEVTYKSSNQAKWQIQRIASSFFAI